MGSNVFLEWIKKMSGTTEKSNKSTKLILAHNNLSISKGALMVGLDASGRTTALYKMKLGEVVTTIPTIGFNVETINHKNISWTLWDVGGCDKIRPLWRHYFQNTQAIFFFIDGTDRERLNEAIWSIGLMMTEDELAGVPIAVLRNKMDLEKSHSGSFLSREEIEAQLNPIVKNHVYRIFDTSGTTGQGLFECLDWLAEHPVARPKDVKPKVVEEEESLLEKWLQVEDEPDDAFIKKLENCTLETWDHRTHLRLAWIYLVRHGRAQGLKKIFSSIENFIDNSGRTNKTFHQTMTYFWSHMVDFGLMQSKENTDFKKFLIANPELSNGGLFLRFYKKETMLNLPEARKTVVLPDVKPLPSILSDLESLKSKKVDLETFLPKAKSQSDNEFLQNFVAKTLPSWSHASFLRVLFCVLAQEMGDRKKKIDFIFEKLKEFQKSGFHLTLTYFWIQIIDFRLHSKTYQDFDQFKQNNKDLMDENYFLKYYHKNTILKPTAATEMVLPDIKPLPSLLNKN